MGSRDSKRVDSHLNWKLAQQPLRWAFHSYLDCNLFIIEPKGDAWRWSLLFRAWNEDTPIHLEHRYGQRDLRIAFDRQRLQRCLRTGKAELSGFRGLYDLLVPVRSGRRNAAVLLAGPLRLGPPSADELRRHWRSVSGRNASGNDPELIAFARLHYRVPALGRGGLLALRRLLLQYAQALGQSDSHLSAQDWERVAGPALTKYLGHRFWASSLVGQGAFDFPARWSNQALMAVESGPMRFSGPARAVFVLEPVLGARDKDALDAMALGARLQRLAFTKARPQADVEAVRLDDRRSLLLLRPRSPGTGPAVQAELRRSALAWKHQLEKELGHPVKVGVGVPVPEWTSLRPSLVAALGEDPGVAAASGDWSGLAVTEQGLGQALQGRNLSAFRSHARELGRQIEALSFGQPQALKVGLMGTMARLLQAQGALLGLGDSAWHAFRLERLDLEAAIESRSMLGIFEAWVDRVGALRMDPAGAGRETRLDRLDRALRADLQRPWTLNEAAQEAGYSPSAFSRLFKARQGQGFAARLRGLRLAWAARCLRESDLPMVEVAALCGIPNPSHFGRLFKVAQGLSPLAYRARNNKKRTSVGQN